MFINVELAQLLQEINLALDTHDSTKLAKIHAHYFWVIKISNYAKHNLDRARTKARIKARYIQTFKLFLRTTPRFLNEDYSLTEVDYHFSWTKRSRNFIQKGVRMF